MFEHILKLFTEEPEKLKKAFIKSLALFNSLLLSFWLYRNFIGVFSFLDINDYPKILEFFSNGKILISLFVFSIGYYILDFTVSISIRLVTFILNWIASGIKISGGEIEFILKKFDVVEFNKKESKIIKGKNFDLIYQIIKELNQESTINEIQEYISFRYKPILVSSSLIYFFILPQYLHNKYLNWLVPLIALLIILLEIFIEKIFEYIIQNRKTFTSSFDFILINHEIYESLMKMRNVVDEVSLSANFKHGILFNIDSSSYRMAYLQQISDSPISISVERIHYLSKKTPEYIFALSSELYNKIKLEKDIVSINNRIIVFESIENLRDEIYKYLKSLRLNLITNKTN